MRKLSDIAKLIRSKNAGPFVLTIDIMFDDQEKYLEVKNLNILNNTFISDLYRINSNDIKIENFDAANSIKITFPRPYISGSIKDSDAFGGQQYGPLVDIEIP